MGKSSQSGELVQVPEGYEVNLVKQASEAGFSATHVGVLIADFGPQEYLAQGFDTIDQWVRQNPVGPIVWVFQKAAVEYWTSDTIRMSVLLRRWHQILQIRIARGGTRKVRPLLMLPPHTTMADAFKPDPGLVQAYIVDCVYVHDTGPSARALMSLLGVLGCSICVSDEGNNVFVEVRRPDNVVFIGLPGKGFTPPAKKPDLHRIYKERDAIEQSSDSQAELLELEQAETACIEQAVQAATPIGKRLFGKAKPDASHPLLSSMMTGLTAGQLPQFAETFRRSIVGVQRSEGVVADGNRVVGTEKSPTGIASTKLPDGKPGLLVCADPPLFEMRYPQGFNAMMTGDGVFQTALANANCAGIFVNNALRESGVIISREAVISAMKSS